MPRDYDSVYKAFYERLFQRWKVPVETQVEVLRRARAIDFDTALPTQSKDVVIHCEEQHLQRLQETCFWFFRRINDLELKSPKEPLDLADYMTIVSRAYLPVRCTQTGGLLAKQENEVNQLPTNASPLLGGDLGVGLPPFAPFAPKSSWRICNRNSSFSLPPSRAFTSASSESKNESSFRQRWR